MLLSKPIANVSIIQEEVDSVTTCLSTDPANKALNGAQSPERAFVLPQKDKLSHLVREILSSSQSLSKGWKH